MVIADQRPDLSDYHGDLEISALTGEGLDELIGRLAVQVEAARNTVPVRSTASVLHRPEPEGVVVTPRGRRIRRHRARSLRAVALST